MVMDEDEIANEALRVIITNPDFNSMKDLIGRSLDITDKVLDEAVKVLFNKPDIVLDIKKNSTLRIMRITYACGVSCEMADFLETIAPNRVPTMLCLSQDDNDMIQKLKDFAKRSSDDASTIQVILEEMKKIGKVDLAWG